IVLQACRISSRPRTAEEAGPKFLVSLCVAWTARASPTGRLWHTGCRPVLSGLRRRRYRRGEYRARLAQRRRSEMEASMKSQRLTSMNRVLSRSVLRVATDPRTWVLASALATAGGRAVARRAPRIALPDHLPSRTR